MATATEPLFAPQTIATAPDTSKLILEHIQKSYGFIPNLLAIFANSPTVLQGYLALDAIWEKGSFPPSERQLILLAASVENGCDYCAAAHSAMARGTLHTREEIVAAIRNNTSVPDAKLNALVALVEEIVRERGYASEETIQRFIAAGYRKEQVMELLIGIALKTISSYLDHISPAPIDEAFVGRSPMINAPARGSQNQFGERITITNWLINLLNKTRLPQGDLDKHLVRASLRHAS
jgi:uncharacterized peroxidase-related enzyme